VRPGGVRAIVLYKTTKACVQLVIAASILLLWPLGLPAELEFIANELRQQVTHAWATNLAALLVGNSVRVHLVIACVALTLDGAFTAVEAWALATARWWGPWLVVAATSAMMPIEIVEIWRTQRLSRVLLLAANLLVVLYLGHRTWREHQASSS